MKEVVEIMNCFIANGNTTMVVIQKGNTTVEFGGKRKNKETAQAKYFINGEAQNLEKTVGAKLMFRVRKPTEDGEYIVESCLCDYNVRNESQNGTILMKTLLDLVEDVLNRAPRALAGLRLNPKNDNLWFWPTTAVVRDLRKLLREHIRHIAEKYKDDEEYAKVLNSFK